MNKHVHISDLRFAKSDLASLPPPLKLRRTRKLRRARRTQSIRIVNSIII